MKRIVLVLAVALISSQLFPLQQIEEFQKGVAYFLVDDIALARSHLNIFFAKNPQPMLKTGFSLLLENQKWEATKRFKDYLESNYRSTEALIGVSLAIADMKNSLTVENLGKTLRLNPKYSLAYLCLGVEYMKRKNLPLAEQNLLNAIKLNPVPEYKIHLAEFYLRTGESRKALDLIKNDADTVLGNFYLNWLVARAYFALGQYKEMDAYIESALQIKPESPEVLLLKGKYYMNTGDLKRARSILEKLRFNYYNEDHARTMAELLIKMNQREAENYLYEFFSLKPWDAKINRLMGLFYLKRKEGNIQYWIIRSLLSGNKADEIKALFGPTYSFPESKYSSFVTVKKIAWAGDRAVLLAGNTKIGDEEALYLIDPAVPKILKTWPYKGSFLSLTANAAADKWVLCTSAVENEQVYLYQLNMAAKNFSLRPAVGYPVKFGSILVGFNRAGNRFYVTDGSLPSLMVESPFSIVSQYGQKKPIFPRYPFTVYDYDFNADRFTPITDALQIQNLPIPEVQKYFTVTRVMAAYAEIARLIERGQGLDITASESVNIYAHDNPNHFIISLSDLKNAFRGYVYDGVKKKTFKVDETMFLGEGKYAELEIRHFNLDRNEIVFLTRNQDKMLYVFNYTSLLYRKIASHVLDVAVDDRTDIMVLLCEKGSRGFVKETELSIATLNPFAVKKNDKRRDISRILGFVKGENQVLVATAGGELLKCGADNKFQYVGIDFSGAANEISPDGTRVAVFINGRFFILKRTA